MKSKILACIVFAFVVTGCDEKRYLSVPECDSEIRNKYTNSFVTKLATVGDDNNYYPKWLVKTPDNNIIFIQRDNGNLLEQKIF